MRKEQDYYGEHKVTTLVFDMKFYKGSRIVEQIATIFPKKKKTRMCYPNFKKKKKKKKLITCDLGVEC